MNFRFFSRFQNAAFTASFTASASFFVFGLGGCGGGGSNSSAAAPSGVQATATPVVAVKPAATPTTTPTAASTPTPTATPRALSEQFPLRLACVGDSITFGEGVAVPTRDSYPVLLSGLLGKLYRVRGFGCRGSTLLIKSALPYQKQAIYGAAQAFKPESVVIALGTNDAYVASVTQIKAEWPNDYRRLIREFRTQSGTTRFYLCIPPASYDSGSPREANITGTIAPIIRQIAAETGAAVVDLHAATQNHPEWFPDGLHPNEVGAARIAAEIDQTIRANP